MFKIFPVFITFYQSSDGNIRFRDVYYMCRFVIGFIVLCQIVIETSYRLSREWMISLGERILEPGGLS